MAKNLKKTLFIKKKTKIIIILTINIYTPYTLKICFYTSWNIKRNKGKQILICFTCLLLCEAYPTCYSNYLKTVTLQTNYEVTWEKCDKNIAGRICTYCLASCEYFSNWQSDSFFFIKTGKRGINITLTLRCLLQP